MPSRGDDVNQAGREIPADLPRVDFFHWLLADVPASASAIAEGAFSTGFTARGKPGPAVTVPGFEGARQGLNDFTGWFAGNPELAGDYFGYDGPFPPWNDSLVHHYVFTLYALGVARADRGPVQRRRAAPGDRRPRPRRSAPLGQLHAQPTIAAGVVMGAGAGSAEATRIVAVRHGETVWNAEMRMQGQLDTGSASAAAGRPRGVGEALAGEGIEAIVASDLARAFDTAQAIAAVVGLPIATDGSARAQLRRVRGLHLRRDRRALAGRGGALAPHDPDFGPVGGETLVDFFARAVAALTRIAAGHRGRTIGIVTHGGVLDCLYRAAAGVDLGAARTWELGNAAINRLLFTGERFTLVGWSDTAHLDGATLDDGSEGEGAATPLRAAS